MPARWKIKAAVQRVLSVVPLGERANYVLQRRLGGLPISNAELNAARTTVRGHIAAYERHGTRALADASFFEFGAGFDLHMPLIFWTLGVTRQTVVDIVPRARPALVHDAADRLRADESAASPRLAPKGDVGLIEYLLEHGITYRAPADARATGLDASSVDCVTSTSTLEHIPVDDIIRIVGECRRIIRPDGVMSSLIDYQDHYSYFDRSVSVYNYLKFTDAQWRRYNSDLQYQNRLRHSDYCRLFETGGWQVVEVVPRVPDPALRAELDAITVAPEFHGYDLDDLAITGAHFVLQPERNPTDD